jgi:hypothetical protein
MNTQRWEKLEIMARNRRDDHFKVVTHLLQQEAEQLNQMSQLSDMICDYQSQLRELQSQPHKPSQAISLYQFIARVEEFKNSTEGRLDTIRAKIREAQTKLVNLEKERLKFSTLQSTATVLSNKRAALEEETPHEPVIVHRYARTASDFRTAFANDN